MTNSHKRSRAELTREADRILLANDPAFSLEDVMRVDNVHVEVPLGVAEESGVLLDGPLTGETTTHPGMVSFDDPADDALDETFRRNALAISAIEFEATSWRKAARQFFENGDYAGAEIAFTRASELQALARSTRHHVNRNIRLFGDRLAGVMGAGDVQAAERLLVEAITSDTDYAMKLACVRALVELQVLIPNDGSPRHPFGATRLAARTGLQDRAAQRLVKDARLSRVWLHCLSKPNTADERNCKR